jgi:hypothetical protein
MGNPLTRACRREQAHLSRGRRDNSVGAHSVRLHCYNHLTRGVIYRYGMQPHGSNGRLKAF